MDDPRVKCKGLTDFFYPNKPSSEVALAKAVCNGLDGTWVCPMRDQCLKYAIDHHEAYGVWGGTSERDRRKIQRARNRYRNSNIYNMEDVRFPVKVIVRRRSQHLLLLKEA
jgi:WhiB family redox-sensing transcriptional regulator